MSLKRRLAATVASLMLVAGGLSLSTLTGEAFNCGSGYTNGNQAIRLQVQNYYMTHWLGYCQHVNPNTESYYAGNDSRYSWGGSWHSITHIYTQLRTWDCHGSLIASGLTLYNSAYNQLTSGNMCDLQPQTDSNDEAYQAGVFD